MASEMKDRWYNLSKRANAKNSLPLCKCYMCYIPLFTLQALCNGVAGNNLAAGMVPSSKAFGKGRLDDRSDDHRYSTSRPFEPSWPNPNHVRDIIHVQESRDSSRFVESQNALARRSVTDPSPGYDEEIFQSSSSGASAVWRVTLCDDPRDIAQCLGHERLDPCA